MSEKTKKIVSKAEYVRLKGIRGVLKLLQILSALTGFTCFSYGIVRLIERQAVGLGLMMLLLVLGMTFSIATVFLTLQLEVIDPGIPLTRANTGDLPADESLVRASEQPDKSQQDVLLRPANEIQARHEEQLFRPL